MQDVIEFGLDKLDSFSSGTHSRDSEGGPNMSCPLSDDRDTKRTNRLLAYDFQSQVSHLFVKKSGVSLTVQTLLHLWPQWHIDYLKFTNGYTTVYSPGV